ncbi:transforming growth factor beta regulator 1 [Mortierella claussenii]|nr:transforming growth factor beta regulator 1 [Mortierella claussenii]
MQQMAGSGPSSDSDTSMDDMTDYDDEDEDDLKDEAQGDSRHGRSSVRRSDVSDNSRRTLAGRSRRDITSGHGMQMSSDYTGLAASNNNVNHQTNSRQATSGASGGMSLRAGPLVRKEKPEGAPKQTRRATASKRADRGRPRAVVPLPTNPDGSLNYPIVVGKGTNEVIIENMGKIVWQGRGYHNHRYIFPVGFRSKKQYTSLSDTSKKTYFINEILDGGEQPIFQITLEDMPEKVFRHSSSSGAWELALKGLMELGYNAKTHASGPDMYGLTNLGVIKYIQEMPNAHRCRRYMPLKWIVEEDGDGSPQPGSSHGGPGDPIGSKSPGRKKKINNSLYASNHEVLLETMEEASAAGQKYGSGISAIRPYTPRKYTKRKATADPASESVKMEEPSHTKTSLAPPAHISGSESGFEPMEDVELELSQRPNAIPMGEVAEIMSTTETPVTPRSLSSQEQCYPSISQIQEGKDPLHHYEHSYSQPLMEP